MDYYNDRCLCEGDELESCRNPTIYFMLNCNNDIKSNPASKLHSAGVFNLNPLLNTLSGWAPDSDFVCRYCAPAESIATPFSGISLRNTEVRYRCQTAELSMKYL